MKAASSSVDGAINDLSKDMGVESPVDKAQAKPAANPATPSPRPQSAAINNEKKQRLQPKFDKIKTKVEVAKEKAQVEFKKGAYAESVKLYKNAAEILEIAYEDFGVFKKDAFPAKRQTRSGRTSGGTPCCGRS